MAARDWSKLYKQYKGKWVALADDRMTVVATGKSRRDTEDNAAKLGYTNTLVLKFPEKLEAFAG
jgi:hypothetical protein